MNPASENEPYPQTGRIPDQPSAVAPPLEPAPPTAPPPTLEPQPVTPAGAPRIDRTRAGSIWMSLSVGAVFLVVLLIFVVQNTSAVRLGFLGWHFSLPIGVGILVAAVVGALVMAIAGGVRIIQLRQAFGRLARAHDAQPGRAGQQRKSRFR